MRAPTRSVTLHLIRNCPEAQDALGQWRGGNYTFEEAMMEVAKRLFLAREELQRKCDYIPPEVRAGHQPPV